MKYSLNFKILFLACSLLLILIVLIIRATAARQRRVIWLEDLNRQVVPLEIGGLVGTPERGTPRPAVSLSRGDRNAPEAAPPPPPPSIEKDTRRRDEIERERARLERILDSLPPTGLRGRSYFMRLAKEMELCWQKLSLPEPGLHHEGELSCYRLARRMVEDHGPGGGAAMETMDRYMASFVDEVQLICLRQRFPASRERAEFTRWACGGMEKAETHVLIFMIRLLGIMGDRDSVKSLQHYRQSGEGAVRTAAVWAMGMQGSPDVIDDIGKILADQSLPAGEGGAFMVALERIGGGRAAAALREVVRDARPLLAYEAYLSLEKLRGQPGRVLSLEEFEQGRSILCEDYSAWLKAQDARSEGIH